MWALADGSLLDHVSDLRTAPEMPKDKDILSKPFWPLPVRPSCVQHGRGSKPSPHGQQPGSIGRLAKRSDRMARRPGCHQHCPIAARESLSGGGTLNENGHSQSLNRAVSGARPKPSAKNLSCCSPTLRMSLEEFRSPIKAPKSQTKASESARSSCGIGYPEERGSKELTHGKLHETQKTNTNSTGRSSSFGVYGGDSGQS